MAGITRVAARYVRAIGQAAMQVSQGMVGTKSVAPLAALAAKHHTTSETTQRQALWVLGLAAGGAVALLAQDPIQCEESGFKANAVSSYENRIRNFSNPDKVFRYFASVSVGGETFMTRSDFVRSMTPNERQPKEVGLDLFDKKDDQFGVVSRRALKTTLFNHDTRGVVADGSEYGLISYSEYLFLLTLISGSTRQFELAFKMFDMDGNGIVDLNEFQQVQAAVQSKTSAGKSLPATDSTTMSKKSIERSAILQKLFGPTGDGKLEFGAFKEFLHEVQDDLLHIDFLKHSGGQDVISAPSLANMLLKYTRLKPALREELELRVSQREATLSFQEVAHLYRCLRALEDLELALKLHVAAGKNLTPAEFARACKAATGVTLTDNTTQFVFLLFDKDGDGELAYSEFFAVMRDAGSRGLGREKKLPFRRGFTALLKCIKFQLSQPDNEE
eukprot:m.317859 g.317859  ORF g.317859 m.317859 type:complete len:446 (+) comp15987_c1_seq4:54-1391(+)